MDDTAKSSRHSLLWLIVVGGIVAVAASLIETWHTSNPLVAINTPNQNLFALPTPHISLNATAIERLQTMARFASISYQDGDLVANWTCRDCSHQETAVIKDDIHVIWAPEGSIFVHQSVVAVSEKLQSILVSVAGSESPGDWIENLMGGKKPFPLYNETHVGFVDQEHVELAPPTQQELDTLFADYHQSQTDNEYSSTALSSKVHAGFLKEWGFVAAKLEYILATLQQKHPQYTVTFVGHSLGGAVALIGASDLVYRGLLPANKTEFVSFGQPRVGNKDFRRFVRSLNISSVMRVVNEGDAVPHFGFMSWGFRHVETEFWALKQQDSMNVVVVGCNDVEAGNEGEDTDCMNSVPAVGLVLSHRVYLGVVIGKHSNPMLG